jgi:hypothetical protein
MLFISTIYLHITNAYLFTTFIYSYTDLKCWVVKHACRRGNNITVTKEAGVSKRWPAAGSLIKYPPGQFTESSLQKSKPEHSEGCIYLYPKLTFEAVVDLHFRFIFRESLETRVILHCCETGIGSRLLGYIIGFLVFHHACRCVLIVLAGGYRKQDEFNQMFYFKNYMEVAMHAQVAPFFLNERIIIIAYIQMLRAKMHNLKWQAGELKAGPRKKRPLLKMPQLFLQFVIVTYF